MDIRRGGFLPRERKGNEKETSTDVQSPKANDDKEEREVFTMNHGDLAAELWVRESQAQKNQQSQHEPRAAEDHDGPVDDLMDLDEDLGEPALLGFEEPPTWKNHPICIVDPFIRHKVSPMSCIRKSN